MKFNKKSKKNNNKEGFSMVEALVAITILITSIVGPMTIAQQGLITANVAKNQVTAFFLGQEAVEHVRYIRDSNVLSLSNWLTDLTGCINATCRVDTINNDIDVCSGGTGQCADLKRHPTDGFYGYNGSWDITPFNREFTITRLAPNEIALDVIVSWRRGSLMKSITVHENIFNWQ